MNRLSRVLDPLFGLVLVAALVMVLLTAWPAAAQAAEPSVGTGEVATEQRAVGEIDAVLTQGPRLVVRSGASPGAPAGVTVRAERRLLALLETVVEGSPYGARTLVVRWKRGARVTPRIEAVVTVVAPRLAAMVVSGSGDLVAEAYQTPRLLAKVTGAGDLRLDRLVADELSLEVRGSGDIVASGTVTRLAIGIAGSGDVWSDGLRAEEVTVSIAGSGDVHLNAERRLAVSIAGSGDVVYSGKAALSQTVAGSGSVTHR
jgi:hypothetical protein